MELYLSTSYFIDHDHAALQRYAAAHAPAGLTDTAKSMALYDAVRDGWRYNPYLFDFRAEALRASTIFEQSEAHCVGKAVLLAALLRQAGVPSRMHFYQVQNHLGTSRLEEVLGTNVLVFHGATEVWLKGRWVTVTPAFNIGLCERLGVAPLEFDGEHDAIFQAYDRDKRKFMEYLHDYGPYHDLPYEYMLSEFRRAYGGVLADKENGQWGPLLLNGIELL